MRILGYVDHPVLKITVFKTDTRLSIKFENGDLEQTYKFRPNQQTNSLKEINALVDEAFLLQVLERFKEMKEDFRATFARNTTSPEEDEFPSII